MSKKISEISELQTMFAESGLVCQKSAQTLLRLPKEGEIGSTLATYINRNGQIIEEASREVAADHVVARNPEPVGFANGQPVFNEWLMRQETAVKNYGADVVGGLTGEFQGHRKLAFVTALPVDRTVLNLLGATPTASFAEVTPPVGDHTVKVFEGGYVVQESGLGIAPEEFRQTYTIVRKNGAPSP